MPNTITVYYVRHYQEDYTPEDFRRNFHHLSGPGSDFFITDLFELNKKAAEYSRGGANKVSIVNIIFSKSDPEFNTIQYRLVNPNNRFFSDNNDISARGIDLSKAKITFEEYVPKLKKEAKEESVSQPRKGC